MSPHNSSSTIGQRLRKFRELRGMTQQELELEIDASFGHVSRIESGQVNPSKETLNLIASAMHLTNREIDYLFGITTEPATREEINKAIAEIKPYFQKKGVIAYLLDDRWRYCALSDGFKKLFVDDKDDPLVSLILGKTTLEALLDDVIGARAYFHENHFDDFIASHIPYYYAQTHFMADDVHFKNTIHLVKRTKYAPILETLGHQKGITHFSSQESRIIYFNIHGLKIKTQFSREPLMSHPRFEVVEYSVSSPVLKLLSKLNRL